MSEVWSNPIVMDALQVSFTAAVVSFTLWLIARLSPSAIKSMKDAWHVARKYQPDLVAAVDQPTDPFIKWLSGVSHVSDETLVKVLPRALRAVADAMDEVFGEGENENS